MIFYRRNGSDGSRTPEKSQHNEKIKNSSISSGTFVDKPTTSANIQNSSNVIAIEPEQKTSINTSLQSAGIVDIDGKI